LRRRRRIGPVRNGGAAAFQRQQGVAERDVKPTGAELNGFGADVLDPLHRGDRHQAKGAGHGLEQQGRRGLGRRRRRRRGRAQPSASAPRRSSASPALRAMPGGSSRSTGLPSSAMVVPA
jgi:hypothetical protein